MCFLFHSTHLTNFTVPLWAVCQLRLVVVVVVGWRGSWVLLQALGLAVNLSSEILSHETLKIAEMLKKRMGGVEWGCNTLSSMSNPRKDIVIHLFSLPSFSPSSFHSACNVSSFSFTSYSYSPFPFFPVCILSYSLCLYLSHSRVISLPPLSLLSLPPALLRPWGTIRLHRLTLV